MSGRFEFMVVRLRIIINFCYFLTTAPRNSLELRGAGLYCWLSACGASLRGTWLIVPDVPVVLFLGADVIVVFNGLLGVI